MDRLLVVPGWGGSDAGHWQRIWAADDPRFEVVEQQDWESPEVLAWTERLDSAIRREGRSVVLIAHSLGCHTVARWAEAFDATLVTAALLVAPPDIEFSVAHGAGAIAPFAPTTTNPLPFPALLVASATDPWARPEWSAQLAESWGAAFVDAGDSGHLNIASGHGPWAEGLDLVRQVCAL